MTVKISGMFKKAEREYCGLDAIVKEILDEPHQQRVVVAIMEPRRSTKDYTDGTETPTMRHVHIEVMWGTDAIVAREMLDAAYKRRLNRSEGPQAALPFDGETEATR